MFSSNRFACSGVVTPRSTTDLSPFVHQYENLYTFCRRLPVSLIADDVGLGKTVSAGLILSELLTRQRVRRAMVLCPRILCAQWEAELRNKFGIDAYASTGTQDFLRAVEGDHTVVITTNQSALNVLPQLAPGEFEMLILDEAHKLRNLYGTRSPPRIAVRIRRALEKRTFNYVLMLTATPLHNRLWDMYSLVDLLALGRNHANPFGSPEEFRNYFIDDPYPGDRKGGRSAANQFLTKLAAGHMPDPLPDMDAADLIGQAAAYVPGGIDDAEEEERLVRCKKWALRQGLPEGVIEYELTDDAGHQLAILDLAWPEGLQPGLTQPVCVLIDEGGDVEDAASLKGYRCFASPRAFRKYVREEILHDGSADESDSSSDDLAECEELAVD